MQIRNAPRLRVILAGLFGLLVSPLALAIDPPETIDLRVEDQPLLVLVERIARQCEVGLVAHKETIEILSDEVSIYAKDAKWSDALELLRREYRIELRLDDKRLEVVDAEKEFRQQLERRYYPTAPVTTPLGNYPAPRLGLDAEDDEEAGGAGILDFGDGPATFVEDLVDLVRSSTTDDPQSWERDGVGLSESDGHLIVRHLPAVHTAVSRFVAQLETNAARQLICRLHSLPDSAPAGGVLTADEYRGLVASVPPESSFVTGDGQRNHHHTGATRRYTGDAENVENLVEPVVGQMRTGLVLDVTPHITRGGILCNIYLGHCENPTSGSSTVADARGGSQVQMELPTIDYETTADSRLIPLGGGAVYRVGGQTYGVSFEIFEKP